MKEVFTFLEVLLVMSEPVSSCPQILIDLGFGLFRSDWRLKLVHLYERLYEVELHA